MAKKTVAKRRRPMWFPLHLDKRDWNALLRILKRKGFGNRSEALIDAVLYSRMLLRHAPGCYKKYRRVSVQTTHSGYCHPVRMTAEERGLVRNLKSASASSSLSETLRFAIRLWVDH